MAQTGMTLKQFAAAKFRAALDDYRAALESGDSGRIVAASVLAYVARRNDTDRAKRAMAVIQKVLREGHNESPLH